MGTAGITWGTLNLHSELKTEKKERKDTALSRWVFYSAPFGSNVRMQKEPLFFYFKNIRHVLFTTLFFIAGHSFVMSE